MKKTITIIILVLTLFIAGCSSNEVTTNAVAGDNFVKIPLSEISSEAKHYSYDTNGVKVNYFVALGSDGNVRTAFDACDVCGGYKGYRQEGTDMVCNNCGRAFSIDSIGTKNRGGGCWPSYLSHKIEGDYVLISESEIEKGAFRFK